MEKLDSCTAILMTLDNVTYQLELVIKTYCKMFVQFERSNVT